MKTIEEYASEYAREKTPIEQGEFLYETNFHRHEQTFMEVANHIMSLPLADRLTAEEREKIKAEYAKTPSPRTKAMLMRIFGKAMFAEEGGNHE